MIISRTPFRVSFFGGGTDYPDWYREHGGAVLATTIDKYCYISVRELPPFFSHKFRLVYSIVENVREISEITHPAARAVLQWLEADRGLEIHHDGDLPARSGLGSSSAFTVGLLGAIHALRGRHMSKDALATEAIHVEQCLLREPVGVQDQISASFGGFNHITFRRDGTYDVMPMILPRARLEALQAHLLLVFTGISRNSADVAETVVANLGGHTDHMRQLQDMVRRAIEILSSPSSDLCEFGRLLDEAWMLKRTLSDSVTSAAIDDCYQAARRAGAVGGKLLGAGGGGFMLLFVRPEHRARVQEALGDLITVPFRFETSGSRIVLYQPDGL
jgi:D-glycero-alpha-D-manno-heptose-7-phosphate kinase